MKINNDDANTVAFGFFHKPVGSDEVKKMIERQKAKYGWEFLFIGANIDAVNTAKNFGIGSDRAVNYTADSRGTEVLFDTVSDTVCCMRASQPLTADWGKKINDDHENRK